ncbi:GNAT family N-acetyltransferase [Sulfitobacter pacificus]|uniref:Alanine acetyltransferase n=1 Tax=Sulfitobacter pacificus TaxID=1499314 RepID=A0ABQ5VFJ2_9RHOB|nr:N-acetyltransferase [Sulfitobacter pacificus]GLQ25748.1 alanine acetyltransferase [Sulfitobacter pacificus]
MTPAQLAKIHRAAFQRERPWSAEEFQGLLDSAYVTLFDQPHGFALTRNIAGESEMLTLAVDPAHHRKGIGSGLVERWIKTLEGTADTAFLEVAADNTAAIKLYREFRFVEVGRRAAYYARKNAASVDAIVMSRKVTQGPTPDSTR